MYGLKCMHPLLALLPRALDEHPMLTVEHFRPSLHGLPSKHQAATQDDALCSPEGVEDWCPDLVEVEHLQFPQSAHRSVADYLRQPEARQMIGEMAGSTLDPLITRRRPAFALSRLELGQDGDGDEGVLQNYLFCIFRLPWRVLQNMRSIACWITLSECTPGSGL